MYTLFFLILGLTIFFGFKIKQSSEPNEFNLNAVPAGYTIGFIFGCVCVAIAFVAFCLIYLP